MAMRRLWLRFTFAHSALDDRHYLPRAELPRATESSDFARLRRFLENNGDSRAFGAGATEERAMHGASAMPADAFDTIMMALHARTRPL